MHYRITYLTGRCADGAERDKGTLSHAVVDEYRALCGAKPGRLSAGWSPYNSDTVTCEKCKRAMLRLAGKPEPVMEWWTYICSNCRLELHFEKSQYRGVPDDLRECPQCHHPRVAETPEPVKD